LSYLGARAIVNGGVLASTDTSGFQATSQHAQVSNNTGRYDITVPSNYAGAGSTRVGLRVTGVNLGAGVGAPELDSATGTTLYMGRSGLTLLGNITSNSHFHFGVNTAGAGTSAITGNLTVSGALSKGSGTFLIDHPLDPANKNLYHGFVEAPRYDLIYRGKATLAASSVTASIDAASNMTAGTFAALTQNAQCFVQNLSGWSPLKCSVAGDQITITTNAPSSTDTVSWLVIAERNDPFIHTLDNVDSSGRMVPEQPKAALTPQERARLNQLGVETVRAKTAAPDTFKDVPLTDLIGKQGYPMHAAQTGEGSAPTQRVRLRTIVEQPTPNAPE
jgi:hypothetical protein